MSISVGPFMIFNPSPPESYVVNRFFPTKYIKNVGTFQDVAPLESDLLIPALSEVIDIFRSTGQPDFILLLGTGELILGLELSTEGPLGV
jgi:hypothetical protein